LNTTAKSQDTSARERLTKLSRGISIGLKWKNGEINIFRHAIPVREANPNDMQNMAYSNHSKYHTLRGNRYRWILSWHYPSQKDSIKLWSLSIDSPKWHISYPLTKMQQHRTSRNPFSRKYGNNMAYQRI